MDIGAPYSPLYRHSLAMIHTARSRLSRSAKAGSAWSFANALFRYGPKRCPSEAIYSAASSRARRCRHLLMYSPGASLVKRVGSTVLQVVAIQGSITSSALAENIQEQINRALVQSVSCTRDRFWIIEGAQQCCRRWGRFSSNHIGIIAAWLSTPTQSPSANGSS